MSAVTSEKHQDNLKMYVNDVIGLERDIINAIEGQLEDDRVKAHPQLSGVLRGIVAGANSRLETLKSISEEEGGTFGAAIKEAAMSVTGVLAGIYGKLREHPLSRIVRDDRMAMNMTETSYAMLYTLALAVGHGRCADLALSGINTAAPQVLQLTDLLPQIILQELAADAPLENPDVADKVVDVIHRAWSA
ncbi:hypothetical protein OVA24_04955 [Luteolibacter sp. SL250]|uniref:hypothetical protein n=1 Tax=Luteolibacter sp. SL250 TaxID=2995170 RepID=UPI00226DB44B|nr:hypothetical protein [Luteolibacter sp. SL250]WAC20729.1 hypothetical protein OVA24_04955 [Luteolibacter sp. SL250]